MNTFVSRFVRPLSLALLALSPAACGGGGGGDDAPILDEDDDRLVPNLDTDDKADMQEELVMRVIATELDGLAGPRDLAFNPRVADELWVVSHDDDSTTIIHDASKRGRMSEYRKDSYALHFMEKVSSLAFGADETTIGLPGTFGTCHESRNTYDDQARANDFMGPSLWSSDPTIFAMMDPYGLGSHLDMLHCSPLCVGLAHQEANVYWTVDGLTKSITRYDFQRDHGVGEDDHSDGTAYQYVAGQLGYVAGVSSHAVYNAADKMLYVADTGNGRVVKLDTMSGTIGAPMRPFEPMNAWNKVDDAMLLDVVPQSSGLLERPSGLEIRANKLYVSDNATGKILVFNMAGELVREIATGLPSGSLSGIAFDARGRLYLVDTLRSRVLRIEVKRS